MSYGFQNPFIDGKIWCPFTAQEIGFTLMNKENPVLSAMNMNTLYVSSAELTLGLRENLELAITMSPTYNEALALIDESPFFRLGNTVYFRWGYNDGLQGHISDWYIGLMQMPIPSFGEEISITLKAIGFAFNVNRISTPRVWSTSDNPKKYEDVAKEIAKKYGLKLVFDDYLNDVALKMLRQISRTDLNQGGMTDLMFLSEKAREATAQLIVKNNEMLITNIDQPITVGAEVSHEFHMYGKMDPANNIFPMTSFDPESMGVLFLPHNQGYMSWVQGPNNDPAEILEPLTCSNRKGENTGSDNSYSGGEDLNTPNTDGSANKEGIKVSVQPQASNMEAGKHIPLAVSSEFMQQNAEVVLDSVRQEKAGNIGIMVNFGSVGIPTFIPGMLCRLRGVSNYFSCDYMARRVVVNIESGGASMAVTAGMKGFPAGLEYMADEVQRFEEATSTSPNEENVEPDEDVA